MDPERLTRARELFVTVRGLEPSRREAFLAAECGDDASLRAEVDALLEQLTEAPTRAAPLVESSAGPLAPGFLLAGRYRIESELGAGGMGRVYRATQLALAREVAVKVLGAKLVASADALVRFEREAAAIARLHHPNIVTVYDAGTDARVGAFYAMEIVEGRSLADELARRGAFSPAEAVEVMRQVAAAVVAAHKAGVIHRDLKPANVAVDRSAGVLAKVLDFGIAKLVGDESGTTSGGAGSTASGSVFGTPRYMSPEQACGDPVDARTDVWSLAVMLYELVAGVPPFRGHSSAETLVAILTVEPEPLDRVAAGVPAELASLVARGLRKEQSERIGSAVELERELAKIAGALEREDGVGTLRMETRVTSDKGLPSAAPRLEPADPPEGRFGRRTAAVAVAIGLAVAVGGGYAVRRMVPPAAPPSPALAPAASALPSPPPPAGASARSLEYAVLVQKYRDGKPYEEPFRLAKEVVFEKDYRIRLLVSSPDTGSLYVLNEAPPGVSADPLLNILFPSPSANGNRSELAPGAEVQLPERGWFRFDGERGAETLWLVWSETPIPELEALAPFVNPKDRGAITDVARARAVRDLLAAERAPVEASRDEAAGTTVLRAGGGVLVYELRLEHQ